MHHRARGGREASEGPGDPCTLWSLLEEQRGPCYLCSLAAQLSRPGSLFSSHATCPFLRHAKHTPISGPFALAVPLPESFPSSMPVTCSYPSFRTLQKSPPQRDSPIPTLSMRAPSPFILHFLA